MPRSPTTPLLASDGSVPKPAPQHAAAPGTRAHEKLGPRGMSVGVPAMLTGRTIALDENVPSPSWPLKFAPQHITLPSLRVTHECAPPLRNSVASVRPTTGVAWRRIRKLPSPTWPASFAPQHSTVL